MKDYIENIKGAERRFFTPEIRASKESRTIEGLGIVYNSLSENFAPWMEGGLYEVVERGAANGLLDDEDIMILFNHNSDNVLARNKKTAELIDTPEGVRYKFEANDSTVSNDLLINVRLENVRKSSFAFTQKEVKMERGIDWPNMGKINVRRIVKFSRLFDFSPVTYPAYNNTDALARTFSEEVKAEVDKENERQSQYRLMQHAIAKMKLGIK